MSRSGRVVEFLNEWRDGHGKPHNRGHKDWGADPCEACTAEAFDAWEAFEHAALIAGYEYVPPVAASVLGSGETE